MPLTHYTQSVEALVAILTHGFAWIPNRRNLIGRLVPDHDFSQREPQQFGMISFTEMEPPATDEHREKFGSFGVVVSDEWARDHGADRVIYVRDAGPIHAAWRHLFSLGYRDFTARIEYPNDQGWLMGYENKAVAGAVVGAALWARLLQLYEYMEPVTAANQKEWRIVNPYPNYSIEGSTAEVIKRVSPPSGFAQVPNLSLVRASRADVVALVCSKTDQAALVAALPEEYRDISILYV